MDAERRPVRLWLRALLDRYEAANLHGFYEWSQLREAEVAEREIQGVFAEVGMVIAQLMQVEHGMNAVVRAARGAIGSPLRDHYLTFGTAREALRTVVGERCPPGLVDRQLALLEQANTLRNHLVHGEVSVAIGSPGSPHSGQVLEIFWLDGDQSDALDVESARALAEEALDAVVDIMAALEMP